MEGKMRSQEWVRWCREDVTCGDRREKDRRRGRERELHVHDKKGAWHKNNNKAWQQNCKGTNPANTKPWFHWSDLWCRCMKPFLKSLNQYLKMTYRPSCRKNAFGNCKIWKDAICAKRRKLLCFNTASSSCNTPPDVRQGYSRRKRVTGKKRWNS